MSDFSKYTDYKTVLSVNALIWCNGKILMLKRADTKKVDPSLYAGVGGKVEPHESFYDALIREIEEETGIKEFESIRPYSVTQHPYPPADSEWVNVYFIPLRENPGRKPVGRSEDLSLRRDFAPDEARGEDTPTIRSGSFIVRITKQIEVKPTNDGTFHWIDPKKVDSLPMQTDLKEYIKILSENPSAFILGFFDHDKEGKLIEKTIKIL